METRSGPRKLWTRPWGYGESFLFFGSVLSGGLAAEYAFGPLDLKVLAWPFNFFLALIISAWALLARLLKNRAPFKFLSSRPPAVALIVCIGFLSIIMGLVPQASLPYRAPPEPGLIGRLGLDHLTSSFPLIFIYFFLLIALGQTVILRASLKRPVFLLNHLGLWLLLIAAGLGAPDRQRELMVVPEGGLEWRTRQADGSFLEMPLAIRLLNFDIDEYPAKLAIVDHSSGQALTENGRLAVFQLDPAEPQGRLLDYDISLLEFLPRAAQLRPDLFTRAITQGTGQPAGQAAKLLAKNRYSGQSYQGWVSTGGLSYPPRPLPLGDRWLAMTKPEPRRFLSQVMVYTREGLELTAEIEVNKPLKAGDWLIYQHNYDTLAGKESLWSGFELVCDPWLPLAKTGFVLWALGSLGLIIFGQKKL